MHKYIFSQNVDQKNSEKNVIKILLFHQYLTYRFFKKNILKIGPKKIFTIEIFIKLL